MNYNLQLIVGSITEFLKTLLVAVIAGVIVTEVGELPQTNLSILGAGYLTVAIISAILRLRRQYLMLKVIAALGDKLKDMEGVKKELKDKFKQEDK